MHDIAIIGAGPAGSGLAAYMGQRGWDVALVERRSLPEHKVCGEFLSPEAQGSLDRLGLFAALAQHGPHPLHKAAIIAPDGHGLAVDLPGAAWGLSRYTMDLALLQAAEQHGARLYCPSEVLDLAPDEKGWSLTLRSTTGQSELRARSVVIACGRHPRPALRPKKASATGNYVGVSCHYEDLPMPGEVRLYLFPGGYVGLNPVEGGRVNLGMLVSRMAFQGAGASIGGVIAAAQRANPAFHAMVAQATICRESMVAVAPVSTQAAATTWDRVARIGDAVSMIPPLCGDGMAMALRSAELCGPLADGYLAGRLDLHEWEREYGAQWRAEFRTRLAVGRGLERLLMHEGLRGGVLALGRALPGLAGAAVRATRGVV
jgi:menaquinone-9 beta-reductase